MFDGNTNETNPPRSLEERYESACGASSLKVGHTDGGGGGVGPADMMIAAGGATHVEDKSQDAHAARVGMALLRLHSEFTGAAKPRRMDEATVRANAEQLRAADETERQNRERENGELERLERLRDSVPRGEAGFELLVAIMEQKKLHEAGTLPRAAPPSKGKPEARARAEAARWYGNELRLLALSLKSRPTVWSQLLPWAQDKGIPETEIAQALFYFLDPVCGHCDGHGLHKVKDAPALSAKQCRACNGTGTKHVPEGGSRVLSYISTCTSKARESIGKRLRAGRGER